MQPDEVSAARKLVASGDADACLYWLYLKSGTDGALPLPPPRLRAAQKRLASLGITCAPLPEAEKPVYTENTVARALGEDTAFVAMVGEIQRTFGRVLSTEELKCLLSIRNYLHLPDDVISVLVSYCAERCRRRGGRSISLRMVEKEACVWADAGIDTFESATEHTRKMLLQWSREGAVCRILQISARQLTAAEQKYVSRWLDWGFPDETIRMAYEKTCLNTGGLKWPYLHSILSRWHEKGLHTPEQVLAGDSPKPKKPAPAPVPARGRYAPVDDAVLSRLEQSAREKLLGEKES